MKTTTTNKETESKTENPVVISCRPDDSLKANFWHLTEVLGVTSSELAKRALSAGLEIAAREIAKEKEKEMSSRLKQLRRGITLPTQNMGSEWESPVLVAIP